MSTAHEIENAIRALPQEERQKLINDLPSIFPELSVSDPWTVIVSDPRPRPKLSALGDAVAAQVKKDPSSYPVIAKRDFESKK